MRSSATQPTQPPDRQLHLEQLAEGILLVRLAGSWRWADGLPRAAEVEARLAAEPRPQQVRFETAELSDWDSGLLTFLRQVAAAAADAGVEVDPAGLPAGVRRLLELAAAGAGRREASPVPPADALLPRLGAGALAAGRSFTDALTFLGEVLLALGRLLRGRASLRRSDLAWTVQQVGAQALPIVSLLSFLVGLILAYVGAVQLRELGAQIYVANLVGVGMAREMAAIMTGIILAGRTGAAFAAQLGTMQVNEEIDALRTLGISPVEFLVLPRMIALVLMTPLLCLYAILLGILGGALIGVTDLDLGAVQYFEQTRGALTLSDCATGLIKSAAFGVVVAYAGCLRGMRCGRSSAAVGDATTSAVVTGIVLIVVLDAIFTILFDVLGV